MRAGKLSFGQAAAHWWGRLPTQKRIDFAKAYGKDWNELNVAERSELIVKAYLSEHKLLEAIREEQNKKRGTRCQNKK